MEILPPIADFFRPLVGRDPYNKKSVEENQKTAYKRVAVLEQHLLINTYLVGERLTLADLFTVSILGRGFQYLFDKQWRQLNPNVTRWYETVYNQPIYSAVVDKLVFIDEALKNVPPAKKDQPPKKEKEPAPKPAPKPKAKEADEEEEEEEDKPAPKPKHPLETLPKPTLVLDDWKRKYSNEDTRTAALPWFWENFKPDEYSLWRLDYKYNEELTKTFMSSNLIGLSTTHFFFPLTTNIHIPCKSANPFPSLHLPNPGGFFARLEASRKFIFGSASVFGEADASIIRGAFLVRGQEATPAFDVAPDFDSYEFIKLDAGKEADRAFVDDMWSWDKGVEDGGKEFKWADGKVFK